MDLLIVWECLASDTSDSFQILETGGELMVLLHRELVSEY